MVRKSEGLKELVSKEPLQDITLLDFFACFLGFAALIFCLPVGRAASLEF